MDYTQTISDYLTKFLSVLGFGPEVGVHVNYAADSNVYQILLQTQDPSLIIGYHGENLSALQLILSQHLHAQIGEWLNLSLNVNDYRERRESVLHSLADSAVARVLATGQPHSLPPMPSNERRIVHLYLAENTQVTTSSEGVGKSRCIIISPRIIG